MDYERDTEDSLVSVVRSFDSLHELWDGPGIHRNQVMQGPRGALCRQAVEAREREAKLLLEHFRGKGRIKPFSISFTVYDTLYVALAYVSFLLKSQIHCLCGSLFSNRWWWAFFQFNYD